MNLWPEMEVFPLQIWLLSFEISLKRQGLAGWLTGWQAGQGSRREQGKVSQDNVSAGADDFCDLP